MGLIVVRHTDSEPYWICNVCKSLGRRTVFAKDEHAAFEAHVLACYDRHEDHVLKFSMRNKNPALFDPKQAGDVELNEWVRGYADAILHGRKKL
jgi:hypothetical protein